jgi:hypothetical protein
VSVFAEDTAEAISPVDIKLVESAWLGEGVRAENPVHIMRPGRIHG